MITKSPTVFHIICCLWCSSVAGLYLTSTVLICIYVLRFANAALLGLTADFLRLEQIFIFLSYTPPCSNRGYCNVNSAPLNCIFAWIFSCMNDYRVLSIKLLLALLIKTHAQSQNLYGKICQFSLHSLHSSINTRSSYMSDLDQEHIPKCFYIHASLLSPVFVCVSWEPWGNCCLSMNSTELRFGSGE